MNDKCPAEPPVYKIGSLQIQPGQPLIFQEHQQSDSGSLSAGSSDRSSAAVVETLNSYRDAARNLLTGKYQDLAQFAPNHLVQPGNITAIRCTDGVIVRYDQPTGAPPKVRGGLISSSLAELAPPFSDFIVHFPADRVNYKPLAVGPSIGFERVDVASGATEMLLTLRPLVFVSATLPVDLQVPPPPQRQPSLFSMTNEVDLVMEGLVVPVGDATRLQDATHRLVARSKVKLPVGWQSIEFYPTFDPRYWKPEYAPMWAEIDLVAAVARRQFTDSRFATLDPNTTARKRFQLLLSEFQTLFSGPEEPLHQFLKAHPELLCPTYTKMWSKLRLGARVTDFVFRKPGNDYVLVELESPLRLLFRQDGQQREELTHAFNQIVDWRVFIEDHLPHIQTELGLIGISSNPDALIVIGRSSSLSDENRRKLTTLENQIPKLKILTYEDVLDNARAVGENLFGPLALTDENTELYFLPVG